MTFGEMVKSARQKLGMSQQALAKELGVSFATVNRWENGHNDPKYETVVRFENFCSEREEVSREGAEE